MLQHYNHYNYYHFRPQLTMNLKAFIRYDRSGRVIPGSNILSRVKPKVGNWVEIPASECCQPPSCVEYELVVSPSKTVEFSYTDCDGVLIGPMSKTGYMIDSFCARENQYTIIGEGATVTLKGNCTEDACHAYELSAIRSAYFTYLDCDGVEQNITIGRGPEYICALRGSIVPAGVGGSAVDIGPCSGTTTTTTTSTSTTTTTTTTSLPLPALELTFDNPTNMNPLVGDVTDVADWNTYFDLPTNGTPFTSVEIVGNVVKLRGGSGITLKNSLFEGDVYDPEMDENLNPYLLSIVDNVNCIVSTDAYCFTNCINLATADMEGCLYLAFGTFRNTWLLSSISLNHVTSMNDAFVNCDSLTSVTMSALTTATYGGFSANNCLNYSFPALTSIDYSFIINNLNDLTINISMPQLASMGPTVGDDSCFSITGNTINLTIPAALMTCNTGNPDGDIQTLQSSNTVIITTV